MTKRKNKAPRMRPQNKVPKTDANPSGAVPGAAADEEEARGWLADEQLTNPKFEAYYKAQKIVPDEEWDDFVSSLKRMLPLTFRLSRINGCTGKILERLKGPAFGLNAAAVAESGAEPVSMLPWYPDQMGWYCKVNKTDLKRDSRYSEFRQFLMLENERGNINRQEAVSMIPPLLLDAKPHHDVLDMCAAPGSKTAQLLEALYVQRDAEGNEVNMRGTKFVPPGMVIANDADAKRAYMLVHQLQRLGSPNFLVTTHDGSAFPTLYRNQENAEPMITVPGGAPRVPLSRVEFDRVLCDVPCSGDGTLRKNINLWKQWEPQSMLGLHWLQLQISLRAAQMLKVDGYMVYSTCSFSPIENEAVVAHLVKESQGSLQVEDVSAQLPGLIRSPGLLTWKVCDKSGAWVDSYEAANAAQKLKLKPSMFPPSLEEAERIGLKHCVRVLPHKQDTGGFFITLLKKTGLWPGHSNTQRTGLHSEPFAAAAAVRSAMASSSSSSAASPSAAASESVQAPAAEPVAEAAVAEPVAEPAAEAEVASASAAAGASGSPRAARAGDKKKAKQAAFQQDPYFPLDAANAQRISDFFGINVRGSKPQGAAADAPEIRLFSRSTKANRIYYVADSVASIIGCGRNESRLHIVHTGTRCFDRAQRANNPEAPTRLCQDGVDLLFPFVTKQVAYPSYQQYTALLRQVSIPPHELEEDLRKQLEGMEVGSVILVLKGPEAEEVTHKPLCLTTWWTKHSLALMVQQVEARSMLSQLTGQSIETLQAEEKIVAEKRAAHRAARQAKFDAAAAAGTAGDNAEGLASPTADPDVPPVPEQE